jgi:LacI family transcriptional regulator
MAKLTLRRIAELAGVSPSTASRVLNERPGVRPEVRERVLRIMRKHNYQPDPLARSLAFRRVAGPSAEHAEEDLG